MSLFLLEEVSKSTFAVEILLTIALLFLVGSMGGYCLEVLFRRIFTAKRWVNPGFMRGPWLPLYGFGLLLMFFLSYFLALAFHKVIPFYNPLGGLFGVEQACGPTVYDLIMIFSMTASMILLEFLAGLIFVKGFHVRLWDYSNMKGNIMGIICPLFSFFWFVIAVVYYYALNPFVYRLFWNMYEYIFGYATGATAAHFGLIFLLGIIYGVLLLDFITSADIFGKISKAARNSNVVAKFEKMKEEQKLQKKEFKEKMREQIPQLFKKPSALSDASEKTKQVITKLKSAVMIDPEKGSTSENYDENGRPVKETEDK